MKRKGSDEYHPHLFPEDVINDSSDTIEGNVFHQLKTVASQRVANIDYEQQIERWNQYQEL